MKQESDMNTEIRELSMNELDQVSGGSPVPGGDVSSCIGGTMMTLGSTRILIGPNGAITTWDGNGNQTSRTLPGTLPA